MSLRISNPYGRSANRWLKGEIHSHVKKAAGSTAVYGDGVHSSTIYAAAREVGLDFVCMSVDVTLENGGVNRFGDVGTGLENGVTGISAREIQNNAFGALLGDRFFRESGADYLHVLTLGGETGISICAHPLYYELANVKSGGCWRDIRKALLSPCEGGPLEGLHVSGIEIYNGFTMDRLRAQRQEYRYSSYEESCWDEMLMEGKLYWGFAGNDSFFHATNDFNSFSPRGTVYAAVQEGQAGGDIVDALRRGRFYSSTGVELADTPIAVIQRDMSLTINVKASRMVNWTATVFQHSERGWRLNCHYAPKAKEAMFTIAGEWKYVRVQCESVEDPWERAWLQPITNKAYFVG